jgi:hypothetical protein
MSGKRGSMFSDELPPLVLPPMRKGIERLGKENKKTRGMMVQNLAYDKRR